MSLVAGGGAAFYRVPGITEVWRLRRVRSAGAVCTGRLALINWSQPTSPAPAPSGPGRLCSGGSWLRPGSALAREPGGRGEPLAREGHERRTPPPGPAPEAASSQAVRQHANHHPHDSIRQKSPPI